MRRPALPVLGVLVLLSSLLVVAVPAATAAVTVYVDAAVGSNGYTYAEAQNPATPWASLNTAVAAVQPGDRIVVAPGSYTVDSSRDFDPALTIEGPPGVDGAHLDVDLDGASGFTFVGFYHDGQLDLDDSTAIVVRDGDIRGGGIEINGSSGVLIHGMTLSDVGKAIRVVPGSDITIRHNLFTGYRIDGVFLNGGTDILIENNTFRDNGPATGEPNDVHSDVVQAYSAGSMNLTFRNNRVERNANVLMILGATTVNRGLVVSDNYFAYNNGFAVQLSGVQDAVLRNNIYICNGMNFRSSGCPAPSTTFDLKVADSTYTRINDPANTTGEPGIAAEAVVPEEPDEASGGVASPAPEGPIEVPIGDGPESSGAMPPSDGSATTAVAPAAATAEPEPTVEEATVSTGRGVRTYRPGTRRAWLRRSRG